jgi:hypothetical protein
MVMPASVAILNTSLVMEFLVIGILSSNITSMPHLPLRKSCGQPQKPILLVVPNRNWSIQYHFGNYKDRKKLGLQKIGRCFFSNW